jgi:hypothetical protein
LIQIDRIVSVVSHRRYIQPNRERLKLLLIVRLAARDNKNLVRLTIERNDVDLRPRPALGTLELRPNPERSKPAARAAPDFPVNA